MSAQRMTLAQEFASSVQATDGRPQPIGSAAISKLSPRTIDEATGRRCLGIQPARRRIALASRLPRRSICHAYALPAAADEWSPAPLSEVPPAGFRCHDEGPQVSVAAFPSPYPNCRHHVFAEDEGRLKKLDLPSTGRVAMSQRFEALAGDVLSCSIVVLLYGGRKSGSGGSQATGILCHLDTHSSISLVDCSIDSADNDGKMRQASRLNESLTFLIPAAGNYQLQFVTTINPRDPRSEAHLLVNDVRLGAACGQVKARLASLSCIGRVQ